MRTRLERKWMIIMSGIAMAVVLFIGTPAVCMAYQSATGMSTVGRGIWQEN